MIFYRFLSHQSRRNFFSGAKNLHTGTPSILRFVPMCTVVRQANPALLSPQILSANQFYSVQFYSSDGKDVVDVEGPAFAESISEGDIRWLKSEGDVVNVDDVIAEIETDKTTVEVPAPFAGKIVKFLVPDGEKVTAKQILYQLAKSTESGGVEPPPATEPKDQKLHPSSSQPSEETKDKSEPADDGSSGAELPKSAPPVPETPKQPLQSKSVTDIGTIKAAASAGPLQSDSTKMTGDRSETRVKMNRMRQRIAQRLKDAQNTNAMLTTFNEIDLTNVMKLRKTYQDAFVKKHGVKLGLMSPFVRASAIALQDQPVVNAVIEGMEIVYRNYCDISIAVATPKGLVVPVMRNVEDMNYAVIEKTLAALGQKARDGKIAIEDMEGGTFTISNGGVFGSMFGTPIINPPQSAILGMHGIFDRPVAIEGKVEVRPMMYVAFTYDHRLIDGREAVFFLRKIKQAVEDPVTILLNL